MKEQENRDIINTSNLSTKYGLVAGAGMAITLILFQILNLDYSPYLKLIKYVVLALGIVWALNSFKEMVDKDIFIKGIGVGIKLSLVASIFLSLINIILYLMAPEFAFSKYSLEPISINQASVISAILFFETFVFGMLISFMVLQYLKNDIKT